MSAEPRRSIRWGRHLVSAALVLGLLAGAVAYYVSVYDPFHAPGSVRIQGLVEAPHTVSISEWKGEASVVMAELRGTVSHVPLQEYSS